MALIEMQNIKKDYFLGETIVHALQGIDLEIDKGEFVAIWGPSGSGKTTLLNLIGAIDEPTEGALAIAGTDVHSLSDNKKSELRNEKIGYIFQGFNLVPVLSALENVMLPLQIKGASTKEAKEKALYCLQEVGLNEFINHRPAKMSGGQQQRVAIARALVNDPSLVIADEPTANLDSETARMIISIMRGLNEKDAITFIFSTHDQRLLDRVKRLIRLEDGRIVDGGNPFTEADVSPGAYSVSALNSSLGEPGTRLRVREAPTALLVEGATQATAQMTVDALNSSHGEREGEAGAPTTVGRDLLVEGATQATANIDVDALNSSHGEREGEAPTALLVEGATQAPLTNGGTQS